MRAITAVIGAAGLLAAATLAFGTFGADARASDSALVPDASVVAEDGAAPAPPQLGARGCGGGPRGADPEARLERREQCVAALAERLDIDEDELAAALDDLRARECPADGPGQGGAFGRGGGRGTDRMLEP